jgi:hypothetical protein
VSLGGNTNCNPFPKCAVYSGTGTHAVHWRTRKTAMVVRTEQYCTTVDYNSMYCTHDVLKYDGCRANTGSRFFYLRFCILNFNIYNHTTTPWLPLACPIWVTQVIISPQNTILYTPYAGRRAAFEYSSSGPTSIISYILLHVLYTNVRPRSSTPCSIASRAYWQSLMRL